jgi:hypothetical protein
VWAIEGLGIVLAGLFGGYIVLDEEIYCERCNHWVDEDDKKLELALPGEETLDSAITSELKAGHLHHLWTLPAVTPPTEKPFLRVALRACPDCHDCAGLDIDLIQPKTNAKGKAEEDKTDLSPLFSAPDEQIQQLRARVGEFESPLLAAGPDQS